jgi:ketosteroid isomerase-like protein
MDALQVAEALFRAVEAGDVDAVRNLYHPDVRVWHNSDDHGQTRDENLRTLAWLVDHVADRRYEVLRRVPIDGGFLQQHVLHGRLPDGSALRLHAAFVGLVQDGRIVRIEEYLDPAALALPAGAEAAS